MQPLLNIAMRAARRAGDLIVKSLSRLDSLKVDSKGRNDFVTDIDRKAEAISSQRSGALPPARDSCRRSGRSGDDEFVWIIDPLDGTTNFLHGFPTFASRLRVEHRGACSKAVVYDPCVRNSLPPRRRRRAARRQEDSREHAAYVGGSLIGTATRFAKAAPMSMNTGDAQVIMATAAGVRRPGAASLDLGLCGRRRRRLLEFGLSRGYGGLDPADPRGRGRIGHAAARNMPWVPTSSRATQGVRRRLLARSGRSRRRRCVLSAETGNPSPR